MLATAFEFCVFLQVLAFGGKTHAERRIAPAGDVGEDVRVGRQFQGQDVCVFLDFLFAGVEHVVIGHGGNTDEDVRIVNDRLNAGHHFSGADDGDEGAAHRWFQAGLARNKRDIGASIERSARYRIAHLAGAGIGNAAHGVDGLIGWAGGNDNFQTGEQFCLKAAVQGIKQVVGFEHAAKADFATGLFTAVRAKQGDAVFAQLSGVALGGRRFPHLPVHGWRQQQRAVACQAQGGQQVVSTAMRQLGKEVSRSGRYQNEIGAARQVNVGHAVVNPFIP